MRLTALVLNRYGNFEVERIAFDPRPGVLNLLIAPNGAGKSVLRNAFEDLLFKIHNQTPMGFRFGYPNMRIAAEILRPDGSPLTIERRKTRGNALTGADGMELDPAVAGALLGNHDRPLLERLFSLDTERLRQGGKALLESGGDLASALLSASGGIREARQLLRSLEKDRDELAPIRRIPQRPYYRALDLYADARKRLGAAQIKPDEHQARQDEVQRLEQQLREANAQAEAATAEISRLERVRRVRPLLAERDAAAGWLKAHPHAPVLAADMRTRLADAHVAFVKAETDAGNAARTLATSEAQAAAITVDAALLAEAAAIDMLVNEAGAARKAATDLPGVTAQHEAKLARLADMLRQLGSDLPATRAADVVPRRALQARTQKLIRDYTEPMAAMRDAPAQRASRIRELAEIDGKLEAMPAPPDLHALDSLVREIGDPLAPREDAARARAEAAAALAEALARVPGWHGDEAELSALKPLNSDVYVRQDEEVRAVSNGETLARHDHATETNALQAARAKLADLAGGGTIPDAEALAHARSCRDAAWRLIYRHAFTGDKPAPEEERAVTSGTPLPLAFERAMAAADRLADDRAEASDLLARIDEARRSVSSQEVRAVAASDRLQREQAKADAARRAWMQLCSPLPLGPSPSLSEVQTFAAAREKVIEAAGRHAVATHAVETLAARHAGWASRLTQLLPPPHGDLAALLAAAKRSLDEGGKLEKTRRDLETKRAVAEKELRETETKVAEAAQRLELWRTDWQALLTELNRPAGEEPAVTEDVLHLLNDIDKENQAAAALSVRIADMRRDIDRFGQSVLSVAARLGDAAGDPLEATRDLARRLAGQKEHRKQQELLNSQREAARDAADKTGLALEQARCVRAAMLCQIGVEFNRGRRSAADTGRGACPQRTATRCFRNEAARGGRCHAGRSASCRNRIGAAG